MPYAQKYKGYIKLIKVSKYISKQVCMHACIYVRMPYIRLVLGVSVRLDENALLLNKIWDMPKSNSERSQQGLHQIWRDSSFQKTLKVQVPNNHAHTQNLYYNYYYPDPKYLIIGYMEVEELLGYTSDESVHSNQISVPHSRLWGLGFRV